MVSCIVAFHQNPTAAKSRKGTMIHPRVPDRAALGSGQEGSVKNQRRPRLSRKGMSYTDGVSESSTNLGAIASIVTIQPCNTTPGSTIYSFWTDRCPSISRFRPRSNIHREVRHDASTASSPQASPAVPVVPATGASFLALPTELLQRIAQFLPPSSEASLTLSCKGLLKVLGTESWLVLSILHCSCLEDLSLLLAQLITSELLELGQPDIRPSKANQRNPSEHPKAALFTPLHVRFGHAIECLPIILRDVLRDHPDGAIQNILLDEYTGTQSRNESDRSIKLTVTPRIVAGHLLMRCTYLVLFSPDEGDDDFASLLDSELDICKHVSTTHRREPWYDRGFERQLVSTQDYRSRRYMGCSRESDCDCSSDITSFDDPPPRTAISLQQCSFCVTEYEAKMELGEDEPPAPSSSPLGTIWERLSR